MDERGFFSFYRRLSAKRSAPHAPSSAETGPEPRHAPGPAESDHPDAAPGVFRGAPKPERVSARVMPSARRAREEAPKAPDAARSRVPARASARVIPNARRMREEAPNKAPDAALPPVPTRVSARVMPSARRTREEAPLQAPDAASAPVPTRASARIEPTLRKPRKPNRNKVPAPPEPEVEESGGGRFKRPTSADWTGARVTPSARKARKGRKQIEDDKDDEGKPAPADLAAPVSAASTDGNSDTVVGQLPPGRAEGQAPADMQEKAVPAPEEAAPRQRVPSSAAARLTAIRAGARKASAGRDRIASFRGVPRTVPDPTQRLLSPPHDTSRTPLPYQGTSPETGKSGQGPAAARPTDFDPDAFIDGEDEMLGIAQARGPGMGGPTGRGGGIGGGGRGGGRGRFGGGGGLGGGMGGGRFGGGGLGGGGLGGGGGGRADALINLISARQRAAAAPAPKSKRKDRVSLFDPTKLFTVLQIVFWPMNYLHLLMWPAVALAALTIFTNATAYGEDLRSITLNWSMIATCVASWFTSSLVAHLAQGVMIQKYGGVVKQFGVALELGILPRFFVDRTGIASIDRRGQLWAWGAPIASRLWLFSLMIFLWAAQRKTGSALSLYTLVIAHAAFIELLIVGSPFMRDGGNFLGTFFGDPNLRKKASAAFQAWIQRKPRPPIIRPEENKRLILFGVAFVLGTGAFVILFLSWIGVLLASRLAGPGVVIFLVLCAIAGAWVWHVRRTEPLQLFVPVEVKDGEIEQGFSPRTGAFAESEGDKKAEEAEASVALWGRVAWILFFIILVCVAFIPYNYETSGPFSILPATRNQANARTDGEIFKILVNEGDWVDENQQIAQISSWDQERDVAVDRAKLAQAKAKLAQLVEGAKPEAIAVAERQVEAQRASVAYNKAELDRAAELLKTGTVAQAYFEKAKKNYDDDVTKLQTALANLDLVRSAATQSQLDAAKADVEHVQAQLNYHEDQLERTRVRAPGAGRVITPNLYLLVGKWLKSGEKLLDIENTRSVDAEIYIPETDVSLVKIGNTVRVKAWGYSDREIAGKVVFISPAAEKQSYGMVVRVKATIPNEDGFLKSGMSGYAKVNAHEMDTWYAFARYVIRFFQVEVWSWIP